MSFAALAPLQHEAGRCEKRRENSCLSFAHYTEILTFVKGFEGANDEEFGGFAVSERLQEMQEAKLPLLVQVCQAGSLNLYRIPGAMAWLNSRGGGLLLAVEIPEYLRLAFTVLVKLSAALLVEPGSGARCRASPCCCRRSRRTARPPGRRCCAGAVQYDGCVDLRVTESEKPRGGAPGFSRPVDVCVTEMSASSGP